LENITTSSPHNQSDMSEKLTDQAGGSLCPLISMLSSAKKTVKEIFHNYWDTVSDCYMSIIRRVARRK